MARQPGKDRAGNNGGRCKRVVAGAVRCCAGALRTHNANTDAQLAAAGRRALGADTASREHAAHDKSLFLLIQVLCGCNALGTYFAAAERPAGDTASLCRAAHVGLAIFYKPLVFPLWYCLLTVLDASGRALPHNAMTETLCFVVQGLFAVWFAACGALSLPLVCAPYLYLGLAFCVPYALCRRSVALGEKWLVQRSARLKNMSSRRSRSTRTCGLRCLNWTARNPRHRARRAAAARLLDLRRHGLRHPALGALQRPRLRAAAARHARRVAQPASGRPRCSRGTTRGVAPLAGGAQPAGAAPTSGLARLRGHRRTFELVAHRG